MVWPTRLRLVGQTILPFTQLKQWMLSLFVTMHFNLVTDPPQVRYSKLTETRRPLLIKQRYWVGSFWYFLIVSIKWQHGLTYKAAPFGLTKIVSELSSYSSNWVCLNSILIAILKDIQWCPIEMRAACFAHSFLQKRGVLEWGRLQVGSSHSNEKFSL